jgi:hypothetical protein
VRAGQLVTAPEILAVHAAGLAQHDELDRAVGVRVQLFDTEEMERGEARRRRKEQDRGDKELLQ